MVWSLLAGTSVDSTHGSFEIVSFVTNIETVAVGQKIRELARLRREYGPGRWRKLKGVARVRLDAGWTVLAEVHWYEATGIGKREMKLKRILGD